MKKKKKLKINPAWETADINVEFCGCFTPFTPDPHAPRWEWKKGKWVRVKNK